MHGQLQSFAWQALPPYICKLPTTSVVTSGISSLGLPFSPLDHWITLRNLGVQIVFRRP
jgi:hypothetical protein